MNLSKKIELREFYSRHTSKKNQIESDKKKNTYIPKSPLSSQTISEREKAIFLSTSGMMISLFDIQGPDMNLFGIKLAAQNKSTIIFLFFVASFYYTITFMFHAFGEIYSSDEANRWKDHFHFRNENKWKMIVMTFMYFVFFGIQVYLYYSKFDTILPLSVVGAFGIIYVLGFVSYLSVELVLPCTYCLGGAWFMTDATLVSATRTLLF